jgi:hypothetical protein
MACDLTRFEAEQHRKKMKEAMIATMEAVKELYEFQDRDLDGTTNCRMWNKQHGLRTALFSLKEGC